MGSGAMRVAHGGSGAKAHALAARPDCHNFQQNFTGVPVHIKYVFTGIPKILNKFSRE